MAQQSKSETLITPITIFIRKDLYKTGTSDRAVVRFSNLRVLILIDLSISLSVHCFKNLNSGGAKAPSAPPLTTTHRTMA